MPRDEYAGKFSTIGLTGTSTRRGKLGWSVHTDALQAAGDPRDVYVAIGE